MAETGFTLPASWVLAIIVSIGGSFATVTGFAMQASAVREASEDEKAGKPARWKKMGELVFSPKWIIGGLIHTLVNVFADITAYYLAPMSLTAPLSGVTVVLNTSLAPRLLGEKLHPWPDLPATVAILIGTVLTTSMGSHDDVEVNSVEQMQQIVLRPAALAMTGGIMLTIAVAFLLQKLNAKTIEHEATQRVENPSILKVIQPAWAAAATATLTNLALKSFSEFLKVSLTAAIVCFITAVVPCAMVQIQSINRGLRLYPQTVFFPIYSSLLVLTNSFFGSMIFLDYLAMKADEISVFGLGVAFVMAGISLYSLRKSDDTKESGSPDESGSLYNQRKLDDMTEKGTPNDKGSEPPLSKIGLACEEA
jgi:drug/metabolite transporter (DMT)-like permease